MAAINPGQPPDRIELFCRTQALADTGRAWLERVAGSAVLHLAREITDPQAGMAAALADQAGRPGSPAPSTVSGLPPEPLSAAIDQALRSSYGDWADEPIPLLDD